MSAAGRFEHLQARLGWKRIEHRVRPGIYRVGEPTPESPVFVSANYTLSFDALRTSLAGIDAYILVLDTFGINVWCAAGKGTFGTDELVGRIASTGLDDVVSHRELIVPQLGATGIAGHQVKERSGFKVRFGPVRAEDIPAYLGEKKATTEMRLVRFDLADRLLVVPVELVHALLPVAAIAVAAFFLSGLLGGLAVITAGLAGLVLFPMLLPYIPGRDFSVKGFLLGALAALPFAVAIGLRAGDIVWWERLLGALPYALALPVLTSFIALNFTGCSTFTSLTWVKREMYTYIPYMAGLCGAGIAAALAYGIVRIVGG
jgi:hypothetical protein